MVLSLALDLPEHLCKPGVSVPIPHVSGVAEECLTPALLPSGLCRVDKTPRQ